MQRAKIIRVKVHKGRAGLFYATSRDLKMVVAKPDMDALFEAIPEAIEALFAARGEKVKATLAHDDGEFYPWLAIPAEVIDRLAHAAP